jgi:hypothetical protein
LRKRAGQAVGTAAPLSAACEDKQVEHAIIDPLFLTPFNDSLSLLSIENRTSCAMANLPLTKNSYHGPVPVIAVFLYEPFAKLGFRLKNEV